MVYTLTLNPSLDYVMYPSAYLKKGGTNRSDREELRAGGKGINVDLEAYFNGGEVYVITEGGQYNSNNDTSSPKGIKVDGDLTITGGTIWVRTSGKNGEGIETKSKMVITGGEVASYAYDDAINSKSDMTISGGYVYAQGQDNDGLDANGNCYIKGGLIYAICSGTPEVAIDANTEGGKKLYVTGGTIVAVGGLESGSQLSQNCYQTSQWSTRGTPSLMATAPSPSRHPRVVVQAWWCRQPLHPRCKRISP